MDTRLSSAATGGERDLERLVMRLTQVTDQIHKAFESVAATHGLTGGQAGVLFHISEPVSMRDLADEMTCQPSNLTNMVDRLETAAMLVRTPSVQDRRVKKLVLTDAGAKTRDQMREEAFQATGIADVLTPEGQEQLSGFLARILGTD